MSSRTQPPRSSADGPATLRLPGWTRDTAPEDGRRGAEAVVHCSHRADIGGVAHAEIVRMYAQQPVLVGVTKLVQHLLTVYRKDPINFVSRTEMFGSFLFVVGQRPLGGLIFGCACGVVARR